MINDIYHQQFLLLKNIADQFISKRIYINETASFFSGGLNGPYFDLETPIRNTAHWLITYSILYKKTGENVYKEIANSLVKFLIDFNQPYFKEDIFIQRQKRGKDWSNGVIGQAWITEALAIAGRILNDEKIKGEAIKCANSLHFVPNVGAWKRPKMEEFKSQIDYTLNHQLWFAAAKAEALYGENDTQIDTFLTALYDGAFRIRDDGRICHLFYSKSPRGIILDGRYKFIELKNPKLIQEKEVGYHLYNLHPLARLKTYYPNHPLFKNSRVKQAIDYSDSNEFQKLLENNMYAYPYNSPAFELPLVYKAFKKDMPNYNATIDKIIKKQIEYTYDNEHLILNRNTPDVLTLNSRIYEFMLIYS